MTKCRARILTGRLDYWKQDPSAFALLELGFAAADRLGLVEDLARLRARQIAGALFAGDSIDEGSAVDVVLAADHGDLLSQRHCLSVSGIRERVAGSDRR